MKKNSETQAGEPEIDTPMYPSGRTIYYFFPKGPFHQAAVQHIIRQEYEVYTLSDYKAGISFVTRHQGAVLFINLDSRDDISDIVSSLRSRADSILENKVDIRLLSRDSSAVNHAENAMEGIPNLKISAASTKVDTFIEEIDKLLLSYRARGQRKYVRFGSNLDNIAYIRFSCNGKHEKAVLHDISSAGLSFSLPDESALPLDSRLENISIDLGYVFDRLSGNVNIQRTLPDGSVLHVLQFGKAMPAQMKDQLRFVIHASLQRQFHSTLSKST